MVDFSKRVADTTYINSYAFGDYQTIITNEVENEAEIHKFMDYIEDYFG